MTQPIRIAFIGAGIFAQDTHLPSLLELDDTYHIAAVYSRTESTAQAFAENVPYKTDITTDLDAVLERDDIDVLNIVLPIQIMPEIVEKALRSGKHVISEKPIAPTVAQGKHLLSVPRQEGQLWMVAENWRYEMKFEQAGSIVGGEKFGKPLVFDWAIHIPVDTENKYYHTAWRRSGDFPGGFLLDGGVHHVAAIRTVVGKIVEVTAMVTQHSPDLPPADTLAATLKMANGAIGTYTITYAGSSHQAQYLNVLCERGIMHVNREHFRALWGDDQIMPVKVAPHGVREEFRALAESIHAGKPHKNTPEQALQDVAVVEAMLESARTGQRVLVEQFV